MELPIYAKCMYQSVVACATIIRYLKGESSKEDVIGALKEDSKAIAKANEGERFGFRILPVTALLHGVVCAYMVRENTMMLGLVVAICSINVASLFYKHGIAIEMRPLVLVNYVQNVVGFIFAFSIFGFFPLMLFNKLTWIATDKAANAICADTLLQSTFACQEYTPASQSRPLLYALIWIALGRRLGFVSDMLINHELYRETVQRRLKFKLSYVQHAVDAFYSLTYGLLAQLSSMLLLEKASLFLAPAQITMVHITIIMFVRGMVMNVAYNFVGTAYFIFHRLGHCKTVYYLFHREHHLPFNQSALSGALGSGLNEGLLELFNTTLPYIMIPCYDFVTVSLYSSFNECSHLYYKERGWLRAGGMKWFGKVYALWRCPVTFITNNFAFSPFFDGFYRFGYDDKLVDTEDVFHGAHHWKNAPYFGYGFFDSFFNNADKLEEVAEAYHQGKYRSMGKGFSSASKTGGFDSKRHFS